MILPDSNVWIYGIDKRADEHEATRAWFERAEEEVFLIPTIVQLEVLHYVSRNVGGEDDRSSLADGLFSFPANTEALTPTVVRKAESNLQENLDVGVGGRDAAILTHARQHDATLVTHDEPLFRAAMRVGLDAHDPAADG